MTTWIGSPRPHQPGWKKRVSTGDVAEQDVLDVTAFAEADGQAAVAAPDDAGGEHDVADGGLCLHPEHQGPGGGRDRAAGHGHVLADGAVPGVLQAGLEADGVVTGHDVAVADPHPSAAVDVDAVAVGDFQVVVQRDGVDEHVVAPGESDRPEGTVDDPDVPDGHPPAVAQVDGNRTALVHRVDELTDLGDGVPSSAVDRPSSGDGDVPRTVRVDQDGGRVVPPVRGAVVPDHAAEGHRIVREVR